MTSLTKEEKHVLISILKKQIKKLDELEDIPTNILVNFAADVKYEDVLKRIIKKLKN